MSSGPLDGSAAPKLPGAPSRRRRRPEAATHRLQPVLRLYHRAARRSRRPGLPGRFQHRLHR